MVGLVAWVPHPFLYKTVPFQWQRPSWQRCGEYHEVTER
jgi:hypothetical protein